MQDSLLLIDYLSTCLGCSRSEARRWILQGRIFVNRRVCRSVQTVLQPGQGVGILDPVRDILTPVVALKTAESVVGFRNRAGLAPAERDRVWAASDIPVLFKDEWLVAVDKPSGLPTQPSVDPKRASLFGLLKTEYPYLALHHRLDVGTSGVVLLVHDKAANSGVSKLFSEHKISKTYWALVDLKKAKRSNPLMREHAKLTHETYLARDPEEKKVNRMRSVNSGGDLAITHFETLRIWPDVSVALIAAKPQTGRTHQIRVHLKELGLPILGDSTYGRFNTASRLLLHARSLTFRHPLRDTEVVLRSPVPQDYQACLHKILGERGLDLEGLDF